MSDPPALHPLVAEAARKSRICWLSYEYGGGTVTSRLVWHVWHDDALVVLSGDGSQVLPGIGSAPVVQVTMRSKDTGGRLATWAAAVDEVAASSDPWEAHARALLAVRLNLQDPEASLERWRREATIVRLTLVAAPVGEPPRPLP